MRKASGPVVTVRIDGSASRTVRAAELLELRAVGIALPNVSCVQSVAAASTDLRSVVTLSWHVSPSIDEGLISSLEGGRTL